jgi:hypothetical protein
MSIKDVVGMRLLGARIIVFDSATSHEVASHCKHLCGYINKPPHSTARKGFLKIVTTRVRSDAHVLAMFGFTLAKRLLLWLIALRIILCSPFLDTQLVLRSSIEAECISDNDSISTALKKYPDPVAALVSLQPEAAVELAQPRLLRVLGEQKPQWMTEGDKLRLRRRGRRFMDITDHQRFYEQQVDASWAGNARESEPAKIALEIYSQKAL